MPEGTFLHGLAEITVLLSLCISGIQSTGMHMHPAKATGLTWGCGSTPKSIHILVYWGAPLLASWLAVKTSKVITINRSKPPGDRKEQNGREEQSIKYSRSGDVKNQVRKRKT